MNYLARRVCRNCLIPFKESGCLRKQFVEFFYLMVHFQYLSWQKEILYKLFNYFLRLRILFTKVEWIFGYFENYLRERVCRIILQSRYSVKIHHFPWIFINPGRVRFLWRQIWYRTFWTNSYYWSSFFRSCSCERKFHKFVQYVFHIVTSTSRLCNTTKFEEIEVCFVLQ